MAELTGVDRATLTPVVRQALRSDTAEVNSWQIAQISSTGGASPRRSVYRIDGSGLDRREPVTWSLILKVLRGPARDKGLGSDTTHWSYWKREALVYQARLLDDLPGGLAAPRCFGVAERPGEVIWLWLEDIADAYGPSWPLTRYGLAARHLGRFNGAYLAGRPIPVHPWLSQSWLRSRTSSLAERMRLVEQPGTWEHPLVRRAFPLPMVDRLLRLLEEREPFLRALARLPRTLCHLDAWRGNLFAGRSADGEEQTVAIDWAFVGPGAVGEEISLLVWVSLLEFEVELADAARLEESVFEGYLEGLRGAGWRGDPRHVRLGYLINAALQWGIFPEALSFALDEKEHVAWERSYRRPIQEIVEQSAAVTSLLLDRVAEARDLLGSL